MAQHNDLGKQAEAMALEYLRKNDFEILHCNWRYSYYEVDIIGRKDDKLHIFEIKSRRHFPGATPEESVSRKKFGFLKKAAEEYLFRNPEYKHVQFNILAMTVLENNEAEFFLIEDVFI